MPTQNEIDVVLNKCSEAADEGNNPYWGMTYLQGVEAAIQWMLGEGDCPIE